MSTPEDLFEELHRQLEEKLPFVAYRKPPASSGSIKAFLQKDDALHFTQNYLESGIVFAPFEDKKDAVLIPQEESTFLETQLELSEAEEGSENRSFSVDHDYAAKEQHKQLVQQAVDKIRSGAVKKSCCLPKGVTKNGGPGSNFSF